MRSGKQGLPNASRQGVENALNGVPKRPVEFGAMQGGEEAESIDPVAAEAAPVAALSWILQLPRDLGLDDGYYSAGVRFGVAPGGWRGCINLLPDWEAPDEGGMPVTRLRFRRALVGIGMPTEATDRAFGHLQRLKGLSKLHYRWRLRRLSRRGVKEWKTVCQLTKWYVGDDIPVDDPLFPTRVDHETLAAGLPEMLELLDIWLQAYGLASGQLDIGSISLHDLPAVVPWILHVKEDPYLPEGVLTGMLPIHERLPNVVPPAGSRDATEEASLITVAKGEQPPTFKAFSLLFQAQAYAFAGRGREAIIDIGTSVEAMVTLVVRHALKTRGQSEVDIDRMLTESRWKTIYNSELLAVIGVPKGAAPAQHAKWWRTHYQRRIDAVHKGERITREQALEAVSDTWDLFDWLGKQIRSQPDIKKFGESIRVKRRSI